MVEKVPHISLQSRICDYCRKKLAKELPPIPEPVPETAEQQIPELSSTSPDSEDSDSESQHINRGEAVASLNVCLANLVIFSGKRTWQRLLSTESGQTH